MSRRTPFAKRPARTTIPTPTLLCTVAVLCGAGIASCGGGGAPRDVDLTEGGGWLPYRFEAAHVAEHATVFERGWITTRHVQDLNGDSVHDVIRTGDYGIYLAYTTPMEAATPWQVNLPVEFSGRYPCASVDGVWDVDDDGDDEIVITAWTEDAGDWLIRLIDVATGTIERDIRLAGGPDTRAVKSELQEAAADAERAFQRLRRALELQFRVDPLAAHAGTIDELAVEVTVTDTEAAPCRIDEEERAFILDNLIENALRAMRQSPKRRLEVGWREDGGNVVITVADTGCGIAPDDRTAVLTPGYDGSEGGGLGLSRSRELLGKYGGDLRVLVSAPGRGTVMALLVPRSAGDGISTAKLPGAGGDLRRGC